MNSTKLLKTFLAAVAVSAAGSAHAQIDSCNAFLRGRYIEVGVSPSGSFGSSSSSPAGYHPNTYQGSTWRPCGSTGGGMRQIGFVADPDMDGWSTGTPPYYGDYFLPGSPFEGWSIQFGSTGRSDAWNTLTSGFSGGGLSGSNISYTASGSTVSSLWQGMKDSVDIKQVTSLDTNNLYFSVKITLTNTASTSRDDIYYFRSVDPDNDEMQPGGSFATNNLIEHQSTDTTVVSATALSHPSAYLALGTTDSNATCLVYASWPLNPTVDLATVYNQTYSDSRTLYATGSHADSMDIGIGLSFYVPHLASLDSAGDSVAYRTTSTVRLRPANAYTFTYFIAFTPAGRDSALRQLSGVPASGSTTSVRNVNGANINVYPNPAKDVIYVTGLAANDRVSLTDMMGRETSLGQLGAQGVNTFSLNGIPSGNYIFLVKDENGNIKSRARVQKQ